MAAQFNDDYYAQEEDDFAPPDNSDLLGDEGEEWYPEENEEGDINEVDAEEEKERQRENDIEEALYQYDYEDIIAGMPCRFKYRNVNKEDYGLSIEDILDAEDGELNQYIGLKKIVGYEEGDRDNQLSDRQQIKQKKLMKKRKQLLKSLEEKRQSHVNPSLPNEKGDIKGEEVLEDVDNNQDMSEKKSKRKRKRKQSNDSVQSPQLGQQPPQQRERELETEVSIPPSEEIVRKKKKKDRKSKVEPISATKKRMDLYS
jgi:protein KRI1